MCHLMLYLQTLSADTQIQYNLMTFFDITKAIYCIVFSGIMNVPFGDSLTDSVMRNAGCVRMFSLGASKRSSGAAPLLT